MSGRICRFFQQGRCNYGDRCRFIHPASLDDSYVGQGTTTQNAGYYRQQSSGSSGGYQTQNRFQALERDTGKQSGRGAITDEPTPHDIVESLKEHMIMWEHGKMWPYSCVGICSEYGCLPDFEDLSPEELRFKAYEAQSNGSVQSYTQLVSLLSSAVQGKRDEIKAMNQSTRRKFLDLIETRKKELHGLSTQQNTTVPSLFGKSPLQSQSKGLFGNANTSAQNPSVLGGGNNSGSVFGATQSGSVGSSQTGSVFGGSKQTGSVFGGSSQTGSVFGGSSQAGSVFGGSSQTSSVFGGSSQAGSVFGGSSQTGSVFGGSSQTGSVFGGSSQTGSVFGASNQTSSVFGQATPVSSVSNQTASVFGGPTQSSTSVFGGTSQPGGSVFGDTSQATSTPLGVTNQTSSVFGGQVTTATNSATGIFGTPAFSQPLSTSTPFPAQPSAQSVFGQPSAQGSVFSAGQNLSQSTTGFPGATSGPQSTQTRGQGATEISKGSAVSSAGSGDHLGDSSKHPLYTPLDKLSATDRAAFEAPKFILGKIPVCPPPRELV